MSTLDTVADPAKAGRNHLCPCGSGKKFKHCCEGKQARGGFPSGPSLNPDLRQRLKALFHEAQKRWANGRWMEAVPLFEEITRLDPNSHQAHHDLGIVYLACGQLKRASAALQRAIDLKPNFESALSHLVAALEPQGRDREILVACRQLSRSARDPADRRYYAAKALLKEGKTTEAESELRRLLELAPQHSNTRVQLGRLLADLGRFAEAEQVLLRAIDVAPGGFQTLADIKRMTKADAPLLERAEALNRPGLDAMARVGLHFGLGKAYDDIGDYPAAIHHYDAGNRLRAQSTRLDRRAIAAEFEGAARAFSAEALERSAHSLARPDKTGEDLPIFVLGMPRSGTTLVEQILSSHPSVAAGDELGFWLERLTAWRNAASGQVEIKSKGIWEATNDYLALLRTIGPNALRVTDKAPRNFQVLWLIRLALPKARIIHCRRHPLDTCLSIYFTNFLGNHEYAWDRGDLAFFYRQYERLMAHWRSVLPPDRFAEVDYEALVANPETETRRLIDFVGLDWDDACLSPQQNPRMVKTASLWQARQPIYKTSVERWRRYEPWLGELLELLPAEQA